MNKRLYKSKDVRVFDGVCGGIANYFNIDPTLVRLIWVIMLFNGSGFLAYLVCMIVIPREPGATRASMPERQYDPQQRPED